MENNVAPWYLCFFAILAAGLAGCTHTGVVTGSGKAVVNYPDVWERVLPEEMRTNIANYWELPIGVRDTEFNDYRVSAYLGLEEVYHIDGEEYDDIVLRFTKKTSPSSLDVFYYSFFGGRLLNGNGTDKLRDSSDIYDVLPEGSSVRVLPPSPGGYEKYKIKLSNGMIYDRSHDLNILLSGWTCEDPDTDLGRYGYQSYHRGGFFTSSPLPKKDIVTATKSLWLLVQGLDEPRWVSKHCEWLGRATSGQLYRYLEYNTARVYDKIISLPDGTFLFVGTVGEYPVFHIPRLKSDMSIPESIDKNYKWMRYYDLLDILNAGAEDLYNGQTTCPVSDASHPYCIEVGKDGRCVSLEGASYSRYSPYIGLSTDRADTPPTISYGGGVWTACASEAVRDYIRNDYQIYYCKEENNKVVSFIPCDERSDNRRN